jgi:ADP-heptose:LPS heptosyltransferase
MELQAHGLLDKQDKPHPILLMNVDTLRSVDRYAGVPLCWALTLFRKLSDLLGGARALPAPRKILVIKLSEMGSTVLACPALAELKTRSPDAEIYFLVFKNNAAIIEALNLVPAANIVTIDYQSPKALVLSGIRSLRTLVRARVDTTIDMDFYSRLTAIFSFIVCRGNRVGFHRYHDEGLYRGNLLSHRVLYSPHVHTSAAFMALVKTLFSDSRDEPHYRGPISSATLVVPKYSPPAAESASIQQKLQAAGVPAGGATRLLLINPNSSDIFPLRKWPLENFAHLCERLLEAIPQAWLILTGVASEQKDARYIVETVRSPRCVDFTGRTTFRELLALYSIAHLMVTNDSGPAHFAALLQLPTVVLFGPETPRLYSPLGNHHKALYSNLPCSPCVSVYNGKQSPCQDNRCLKTLTVEYVLSETLAWAAGQSLDEQSVPAKRIATANAE